MFKTAEEKLFSADGFLAHLEDNETCLSIPSLFHGNATISGLKLIGASKER